MWTERGCISVARFLKISSKEDPRLIWQYRSCLLTRQALATLIENCNKIQRHLCSPCPSLYKGAGGGALGPKYEKMHWTSYVNCSKDCIWGSWTSWTACSTWGGGGRGGYQERSRQIYQPAKYSGSPCDPRDSTQKQNCDDNTQRCPSTSSMFMFVNIDVINTSFTSCSHITEEIRRQDCRSGCVAVICV